MKNFKSKIIVCLFLLFFGIFGLPDETLVKLGLAKSSLACSGACCGANSSCYTCVTCNSGETGVCRQPNDLTYEAANAAYLDSASHSGSGTNDYGDGIYFPPGVVTSRWSGPIGGSDKEGLVMKGAPNHGTTLITSNGTGGRIFGMGYNHGRITGFTMNQDQGSSTAIYVFGINDFRIDNNIISGVGSAYGIFIQNDSTGVIDGNSITTQTAYAGAVNYDGTEGVGNDNYTAMGWGGVTVWGSNNGVFLENNVFTEANPFGCANSLDTNEGARFIIRYNLYTETETSQFCTLAQQHSRGAIGQGCTTGNNQNARSDEIYNNLLQLVNPSPGSIVRSFVHNRGGTTLNFGNVMDVTASPSVPSAAMTLMPYRAADSCADWVGDVGNCTSPLGNVAKCCRSDYNVGGFQGEGYPCVQQPGTGAGGSPPGRGVEPMYVWGNKKKNGSTITDMNTVALSDPSAAWAVQENRDYFISTSKPAALSAYNIYTCPHPLVGSGSCNSAVAGTAGYNVGAPSSDKTPPAAPSGVRVQ